MPSHNKRYKKGFKILGIPDVKSVPLLHWLRIKRGRLRLMFRETSTYVPGRPEN